MAWFGAAGAGWRRRPLRVVPWIGIIKPRLTFAGKQATLPTQPFLEAIFGNPVEAFEKVAAGRSHQMRRSAIDCDVLNAQRNDITECFEDRFAFNVQSRA
ncbi:MAG: hypothetical protein A4S12_09040 [Proteobacteria bacterium SG_bin5]|nr:MAG: hypothetical protein A4S12_09040 [Proteobacteria bacterium SG_bin5]